MAKKGTHLSEETKNKIRTKLKGRRVCMRTEFKKGRKTWNKGLKGVMKANKSSFKKGQKPVNYRGGYKIQKDGIYVITKKKRYYIKDGKKISVNIYEQLARKKYREAFGDFDKKLIVYHKDGDNLNNELDNLELISRKELMRRNVENNSKKKKCSICGKEFLARVSYHKTCSEKCYKENCNRLAKKYYQNNKEKILKYKRDWKRKQGEYINRLTPINTYTTIP